MLLLQDINSNYKIWNKVRNLLFLNFFLHGNYIDRSPRNVLRRFNEATGLKEKRLSFHSLYGVEGYCVDIPVSANLYCN